MPIDYVRVCLNSKQYQRPSGGYKAHSRKITCGDAHACGVGMEEWLNSNLNIFNGKDLMDLTDSPFKNLDNDDYRIAFIESFRLRHYPNNGRNQWRTVILTTNPARNTWENIAEIHQLRGLTSTESQFIFNYCLSNPSGNSIANQMNSEIYQAISGTQFPNPSTAEINRTRTPSDVFNCIFKTSDLKFYQSPQISPVITNRYSRRY